MIKKNSQPAGIQDSMTSTLLSEEPDARPNTRPSFDRKQFFIWIGVLLAGVILGFLKIETVDKTANIIATIYTRLFQMLAVPTIALAVVTTLASFGSDRTVGRIFGRTVVYTLLTTVTAAIVGAVLYALIRPGNLPERLLTADTGAVPENLHALFEVFVDGSLVGDREVGKMYRFLAGEVAEEAVAEERCYGSHQFRYSHEAGI